MAETNPQGHQKRRDILNSRSTTMSKKKNSDPTIWSRVPAHNDFLLNYGDIVGTSSCTSPSRVIELSMTEGETMDTIFLKTCGMRYMYIRPLRLGIWRRRYRHLLFRKNLWVLRPVAPSTTVFDLPVPILYKRCLYTKPEKPSSIFSTPLPLP